MKAPKSWEMASQEVKDSCEKILNEVAKLLVEKLGLTLKAAVAEADNMRAQAFEDALDVAMTLQGPTAVQPDWLIVITSGFTWIAACNRCELAEEEKRSYDLEIPGVSMTSSEVKPSPEHLMRMIEVREKELSDIKATLAEIGPGEDQEW